MWIGGARLILRQLEATRSFVPDTIRRSCPAASHTQARINSGILTEMDMTAPQIEKTALFIDGANLYATAKSLGFDIDYKRLLREFQSRGYLMRAFYYTAVIEDQEYSSIRPLIDWLD